MPKVEYTTTISRDLQDVWEFVRDMNQWAPFMTGYQEHQELSETESLWTLKGDVGVLARTVKLKATVTQWDGPERVAFTLEGLNEPVAGEGLLVMSADVTESAAKSAPLTRPSTTGADTAGFFMRLWSGLMHALFGWLFRLRHGRVERAQSVGAGPRSRLTFTLSMDAGGKSGPLVNAMLGPAMMPATESLANKIAAHLESESPDRRHTAPPPTDNPVVLDVPQPRA